MRVPLLLAAVLLLSTPSRAEEKDFIAAAMTHVKAVCKADPKNCAEPADVLAGYIGIIAEAQGCALRPCEKSKLEDLFKRDWALDEREGRLPPEARGANDERPLLQVSLMALGATANAFVTAFPKETPPQRSIQRSDGAKFVTAMCLVVPDRCRTANQILRAGDSLDRAATECAAAKDPCPYDRLKDLAVQSEGLYHAYFALADGLTFNTMVLYAWERDTWTKVAVLVAADTKRRLDKLERDAASFQARIAALDKRSPFGGPGAHEIAELDAAGAALQEEYRRASIGADQAMSLLTGTSGTAALRERANAAAVQLAASRAALVSLKADGFVKRLIGPERSDGGVESLLQPASYDPARARPSPLRPAAVAAAHGVAFASLDAIPKPNRPGGQAPPILTREFTMRELLAGLSSDDPLVKAHARRVLKLSETRGDPLAWATQARTQNAADTCALVTQLQVLSMQNKLAQFIFREKGIIAKDFAEQEAALAAIAKERGYYSKGGTTLYYSAELLTEAGLLVTKHLDATLDAMDAAARQGVVIASVDARWLWDQKSDKPLGHSILVTGVEVNRFGDETVGYYVNDSGTNPPGSGRFVPVEQFRKMWRDGGKSFAQVQ